MKRYVLTTIALLLAAPAVQAFPRAKIATPAPILVEYFCSPGFAPRRGRCIATAARDEIELFETDDLYAPPRHRRRHGLRTLY